VVVEREVADRDDIHAAVGLQPPVPPAQLARDAQELRLGEATVPERLERLLELPVGADPGE
jgi:hypothetical protein